LNAANEPKEHAETVRVSFSPIALAQAQVTANTELAQLAQLSIENAQDAKEANDYLRDRQRELDAVEKMLSETLAPIREGEKRIRGLFAPTLARCKEVVAIMRNMLANWEKTQREAQRKALAEAAAVAQTRDAAALTTALVKAEAAAPQKLEGTSFIRTWKVARIVEGLLLREYLCPDLKKIEAIGKAHKGDEPPIVPGVVWVEDFSPRVRR
jgi:hypothetical protein